MPSRLAKTCQLSSQLFRRSEERIFGSLFRGVEHLANGAQAEPLVMLEFKNHALARSELAKRGLNARAEKLAIKLLGGVGVGAVVGDGAQHIDLVAGVIEHHGVVFAACLLAAKLIETEIGDDAVDPGVEGALKAEVTDVAI